MNIDKLLQNLNEARTVEEKIVAETAIIDYVGALESTVNRVKKVLNSFAIEREIGDGFSARELYNGITNELTIGTID